MHKSIFISMLFVVLFIPTSSFNIVGDYINNGKTINPTFPPEKIDWSIYTHVHSGVPKVFINGTATCDINDLITPRIVELAHKNGVKVQWGLNLDLNKYLWNTNNSTIKNNYLNSIGRAVNDCKIDGICVDYEGPFGGGLIVKLGIVAPKQAKFYTEFLADLKMALGPGKIVSADVSIWGIAPGSWLLGFLPWVDPVMLNEGKIDFINTMSYHWNKDGNIAAWEKDIFFLTKIWKIDPKRVNLVIPYLSMNRTKNFKIYNEPIWQGLSRKCPNIDPNTNVCEDIVFVGKKMNEKIGALIKKHNLGGAFPWAANYDSIQYNNSLIKWLNRGLNS